MNLFLTYVCSFWRLQRILVFEPTIRGSPKPGDTYRDPRLDVVIKHEVVRRTELLRISAALAGGNVQPDARAKEERAVIKEFEELLAPDPNQLVTSQTEIMRRLPKSLATRPV